MGRVLEQAVCKADVDFIKYVVLEQGVGGESLIMITYTLATSYWSCPMVCTQSTTAPGLQGLKLSVETSGWANNYY